MGNVNCKIFQQSIRKINSPLLKILHLALPTRYNYFTLHVCLTGEITIVVVCSENIACLQNLEIVFYQTCCVVVTDCHNRYFYREK